MSASGVVEWNAVGREWRTRRQVEGLWRRHADSANCDWIRDQLGATFERALKTDCFDEATGRGLADLLHAHAKTAVGIDLSLEVLRNASGHPRALLAAGCDIRRLPFADSSFDLVVSNSTLDHFETRVELEQGVGEIARVLRPGGQLLLTLDNPQNPIVALRNLLPPAFRRATGLVPYRVGFTLGRRGVRKLLSRAGFAVTREDALLHVPRVAVIPLARWIHCHTSERAQERFLRALSAFESIGRLPTRYFSGHFVAAAARRR